MRESQGPFGEELIDTESRRLTPSIGLARDSDSPTDSSNEDFLFHLYRGSELLQDNRVHEAKEELERALHLQPRDSKGQDLLAVVYFRLGLYPRAIQIYEQLRRRNANDTALLLNLSLCYLKTGQPQLARKDLEHLLSLNPNHSRAWGYLGLACERLGDIAQAEHAFKQGGHAQMAKRMAARRGGASEVPDAQRPAADAIDAPVGAYQELDAGDFSLEATSDKSIEAAAQEAGANANTNSDAPVGGTLAAARPDTRKPDTKDGWKLHQAGVDDAMSVSASIPQIGTHQQLNRRPTLIAPVGAPPAHEQVASEFSTVERIPSYQPPSFALDDAGGLPPSLRRPVVAVGSPFGPAKLHEPIPAQDRRTLQPPLVPGSARPPGREPDPTEARSLEAPRSEKNQEPAPAPAVEQRLSEGIRFPRVGVVLHRSGIALVQTTAEIGFAARLESLRAQQSGLKMELLERHVKGKPSGESFGGVSSPMVLASGEGQLVLAPRPGRKLHAFGVAGEMCFAREDVLLGFGAGLAFENGRLSTGEGEFVPVVQLRGDGEVLFESMGEILTLAIRPDRSLSVRREVVLGWFGRLVPRAVVPGDAPCGQRGLISFAGEGRLLISSA